MKVIISSCGKVSLGSVNPEGVPDCGDWHIEIILNGGCSRSKSGGGGSSSHRFCDLFLGGSGFRDMSSDFSIMDTHFFN